MGQSGVVQTGAASVPETSLEMELDALEEKIQKAVRLIEGLRLEKMILEDEVKRLREERVEAVARLGRILEQVDSLGEGS